MIEAVGTSAVQGAILGSLSQRAVVVAAIETSTPSFSSRSTVLPYVRVDSLRNVALLEYRNGDGEVVQQFPTEAQIRAFKSAERLQEHRRAEAAKESSKQAAAPAPQESSQQAAAPAPQQQSQQASPSPQTASAAYVSTEQSSASGSGGDHAQSVLA